MAQLLYIVSLQNYTKMYIIFTFHLPCFVQIQKCKINMYITIQPLSQKSIYKILFSYKKTARMIHKHHNHSNHKTLYQQKILAIMQFIHNYHQQVSMKTLLNGQSLYQLLLILQKNNTIIQYNSNKNKSLKSLSGGSFTFHSTITYGSNSWNIRLINYLEIMNKIQEYVYVKYQKSKKVNMNDIDLVALCKYEDQLQIIRLFQLVMAIMIQSESKEEYIQKIMELSQNSQECFVEIIKNSLENRFCTNENHNKMQYNQYPIFITESVRGLTTRIITQLQKDTKSLKQQNHKLTLKTNQLHQQLSQTIDEFQQQELTSTMKKHSSLDISTQQLHNSQMCHLQEQVHKLKERLLASEKMHQTQKNSLIAELQQISEQNSKYVEIEELCTFYKEKYQDIMNQVKVISIWKKQKIKLEKQLEEKEFIIDRINDNLLELQEKNTKLEEKQLELKLQMQTKDVMIEQMKYQVTVLKDKFGCNSDSFNPNRKGTMGRRYGGRGLTLFSLNGEEIKNDDLQENIPVSPKKPQFDPLKKQCEMQRTKIAKLQSQLKNSANKTQKIKCLQETNRKLECLIYDLTNSQNQQIKLLISVMQEQFFSHKNDAKYLKENFNGENITFLGKNNGKKHLQRTSMFVQIEE